jgi:hypothetical protein
MCEVDGRTSSTSYKVVTGKGFGIVLVEMVDETDAMKNPELSQPKSGDALMASFPAHLGQ